MKTARVLILLAIIAGFPASLYSMDNGSLGIRGGVGTDITGGLAYGGGVNYQFPFLNAWVEIGPVIYVGHFEETTEEFHTYEETTDIIVYGVLANYLFDYNPKEGGFFYILGIGIAAISVEWEEKSDTDTSLGTPLPGGGSKQSEDATAAGSVINLGAGYSFGERFDVRAEIPIIFIAGAPGEASAIAPTFTLTAGIRF